VLTFGQDECYGDADAGIAAAVTFTTCTSTTLNHPGVQLPNPERRAGYLNVMVDWNGDGDWNDNFVCNGQCVYEWSVKNQPVILLPGCNTLTPSIPPGRARGRLDANHPHRRSGARRLPVGRVRRPGGRHLPRRRDRGLPVSIIAQDPCVAGFTDFGDAPEELPAYSTGRGRSLPDLHFSTATGDAGDRLRHRDEQPAGPTGYVWHVTAPTAPNKIWLGCGLPGDPGLGRDSENDGKVNLDPPFGLASHCDPSVIVDSFEPAWFNFGQDESYGTPTRAWRRQ
jgi:hypothetical protein